MRTLTLLMVVAVAIVAVAEAKRDQAKVRTTESLRSGGKFK